MSDSVCSSLSDLFHSAGQSLGLSILLQERLFANGVTDKELDSKIYRQHQNKKPDQQTGRRAKYVFLLRRHTDSQ